MTKKLMILSVLVAALVVAGSSYSVRLFDPLVVGGKELKPGEYRLTLEGGKAVIQVGGEKVEANVKVEQGAEKFGVTSVRYVPEGGKNKVQEIRLGGTKTKLIFN